MDNEGTIPPDEDPIDKILREARQRIAAIDEQIKNTGKDKGPQNRNDPPGYEIKTPPTTLSPDQVLVNLKAEKEKISAETLSKVDKLSRDKDPETGKKIRADVLEEFYPNEEAKLDKAQLEARSKEGKGIEDSQNVADARIINEKKDKAEKEKMVGKEASDDKQAEFKMSARFTQSLGYSKKLAEVDKPREQEKSNQKPHEIFMDNEKDIVKDDRPSSMSTRFSQSLGYDKLHERKGLAEKFKGPDDPDK